MQFGVIGLGDELVHDPGQGQRLGLVVHGEGVVGESRQRGQCRDGGGQGTRKNPGRNRSTLHGHSP